VGQRVTVSGYSKGRGFAGVVKKYGFHGPNASHGTHEYMRHPGAVGAHTDPGRIWKGQRMPGRMGHQRVTAKNLPVLKVEPEHNLILIKGAVPGAKNALLEIVVSE
jgi:large subunit ribosomal protein L3